jgi:hypothetical protein
MLRTSDVCRSASISCARVPPELEDKVVPITPGEKKLGFIGIGLMADESPNDC